MKVTRSLRWQLQSYYSLILLLTLGTLTALAIHWMRKNERVKYDSELRNYQQKLLPILRGRHRVPLDPSLMSVNDSSPPEDSRSPHHNRRERPHHGPPPHLRHDSPPGERGRRKGFGRPAPPNGGGLPLIVEQIIGEGWYFATWDGDHSLIQASANFPKITRPDFQLAPHDPPIIRDFEGYRQLIRTKPGGILSVIAYPKEEMEAFMIHRQWIIIGTSSSLFIAATLLGWIFIGRALRPLKAIQTSANDIAHGKLDTRIASESQRKNEIRELSENLNQTFSQFESMFDRQRRFTSDASHELRTPIAVVLSHCQFALAQDEISETSRRAFEACQRAGDRMKNLTNDLLELSKIETDEINFEFTDCSIDQVAEEALELVEPLAAQKGVTLREDIDQATITANGDRLWQVIVNLLNNAIRHTPAGKSVTLKTETKGDRVEISIIDQGEGIPAQHLPHLFDRFYRVDNARSRDKGGSGLGLAICETIIKAHRGTLKATSIPGVETSFVASLPL